MSHSHLQLFIHACWQIVNEPLSHSDSGSRCDTSMLLDVCLDARMRLNAAQKKVLAFLTFSNLAVLCTYETSLAPLQHIQTGGHWLHSGGCQSFPHIMRSIAVCRALCSLPHGGPWNSTKMKWTCFSKGCGALGKHLDESPHLLGTFEAYQYCRCEQLVHTPCLDAHASFSVFL